MHTASPFWVNTKAEAEELKPSSKPLSAMTKMEASERLRSLGEEPSPKWTSVEIRSRITEILDLLAEEDSRLPKNMTRMKKAALQRECTKRLIHYAEHETRGSMMRKIREKVEAEQGGQGGSIMGFGKFSDMTYEEVAENHPAYAKWALETAQEEGQASHWKLRKFVTWLSTTAAEKDKGAATHQKAESGRSSSAAAAAVRTPDHNHRIKRMATTEKDADDMKAEVPLMDEYPIPENKVQEQVLGALEKLDQRLNSLETTQTQPEKHYTTVGSGSWQNLSSDGDGERQ